MSEIIKSSRLIFVDPNHNNNKFYNIELYDDDKIEINWGRVGANGQFQTNFKGEKGYNSTIKSKIKKGYVEQKTIQSDKVKTNNIESESLSKIVKEQINTTSTVAEKLLERLLKANIHQITSQTNIKFDSGVFQTPLGIVSETGLLEAEKCLEKMKSLKDKTCDTFYNNGAEFLKIVPQSVGRNVKDFINNKFGDNEVIEEQFDLLESLKVSLQCISDVSDDKESEEILESVFDVSIEILEDTNEYDRLSNGFYDSKKGMHGYDDVKVANIYKIVIKHMDDQFDSQSWGNIQEFYHGTGIANCLSILKSGLQVAPPSSAKIAGKAFGNGTYGANCASKSLGYSLGRWGQGRSNDGAWLFICDFAMGETEFVRHTGSHYPNKGYHSVSALSMNTSFHNDEFIVYHNDQVNIKYLIECST